MQTEHFTKDIKSVFFIAFAILGFALIFLFCFAPIALAADENNLDDPYDETTCMGVAEDIPPDIDPLFPLMGMPFGWDSSKNEMVWFWEYSPIVDWFEEYQESQEGSPRIDLSISPTDPVEGDQVNILLKPDGFRTKSGGAATQGSKLYATVLISSDKNPNHLAVTDAAGTLVQYSGPVLYNTVAAGGIPPHMVPQTGSLGPSAKETGSACNDFTRIPETDTEDGVGDGMDDDWENLHFADTDKCGRNSDQTCPDNYDEVYMAVHPDADPDEDGSEATRFKNEDGFYATPMPYMRKAIGGDLTVDARQYVVGNARKKGLEDNPFYAEGEDLFPNWQEYVAYTNPLNSDTDGDGNQDEKDLYGEGITSVPWIAYGDAHDEAYIRVIALGISNRKDLSIVSKRQTIYMGDGSSQGNLSVEIHPSKNPIAIGDVIEIKASMHGSISNDSSSVFFEWGYIDGSGEENMVCSEIQEGETARCGISKDTWSLNTNEFSDDLQNWIDSGHNYLEIFIRTYDTISGKTAEKREKIYLGENTNMVIEGCYEDAAGKIPSTCDCRLNDSEEGVSVCGLQGEYLQIGMSGNLYDDLELEKLYFEWKIDGVKNKIASGLGVQTFTASGGGTGIYKHDTLILPITKNQGDAYNIELEVTSIESGERVNGGVVLIPVGSAYAVVDISGVEKSAEDGNYHIPNSGIYTITARIYNINTGSAFDYKFKLNNTVAESGSATYNSVGQQIVYEIDSSFLDLGIYNISAEFTGETLDEYRFLGTGYAIMEIEEGITPTSFIGKTLTLASSASVAMSEAVRFMALGALVFVGLFGLFKIFRKA